MRYTNAGNTYLDAAGKPGNTAATHFPLDRVGDLLGYWNWLQGFLP